MHGSKNSHIQIVEMSSCSKNSHIQIVEMSSCIVLKVWRVEFPQDDAVHWEWTRAIITKLQLVKWKEATGACLKHFESRCFATEGVCTFDMTNEYMEASKASIGAQARSGLEVLSTLFHKSY